MIEFSDNSIITRLTVNESGVIQRSVLNEGSSDWTVMYTSPNNMCDDYGRCGANGICRIYGKTICDCLQGFIPKSQTQWAVLDWSSGCVRRTLLDCQKGEGFVKLKNVKLPDLLEFSLHKNMNLKQCQAECLKNCSCTAFANSDVREGQSGCLMWFSDLIDIREFSEQDSEQDLFVRMPASELDHIPKVKRLVLKSVIPTVSGILILSLLTWCIISRRKSKGGENLSTLVLLIFHQPGLPLLDLFRISES
ncbi:hypothetical protein RJ639_046808 [Escallonia herrerae]|uniref:Apple domain-containing protein n=1 Tax=Escallonia herrerae TaxID=1293975 RepID=A0AA88W882_9ASTE|nr:hypothetical protein RJ639_046808 [Escallonia herrerae]